MDAAELADLGARVHSALSRFLTRSASGLAAIGPELLPVADAIREFVLAGGKRLRPAFCYWGWRGSGAPDSAEILDAAASLELLHACALIHDDVMDGSDTRRGRPAMHRRFAQLHRAEGWSGSKDAFGASAAILLGDLCLVWADQMLAECGLPGTAQQRAAGVWSEMRVELMAGQYLDMVAAAVPGHQDDPVARPAGGPLGTPTERALRIARYKSAKYTVERPLHLGGLLAGGDPELLAAYSAYGIPLGEAFQLRDDILGVFGDSAVTGKPAGDDLREGKRTALVTLAEQLATPAQAAVLERYLGDPELGSEGVDRCCAVIAECGALAAVESLIDVRSREAREAATTPVIAEPARHALLAMAGAATDRSG